MKRRKTFAWIILPIMLLAGCRAAATPAAFSGTITNTPTNTTTGKPESTAAPTKTEASATPRLLGGILYSAALDASKIKNIVALPCQDDVTPVIPSDSKENYNPVVFVLPAAEGGYEKIHVLGGMYKGKGVGIADFLIDNKDFDHSSELICYHDGGRGGTTQTVRYARSKGISIYSLLPESNFI